MFKNKRLSQRLVTWDRQKMIDWAIGYAAQNGTLPTEQACRRSADGPAASTVRKHFVKHSHYLESVIHCQATGEYPPNLVRTSRPRRRMFLSEELVTAGIAYVRRHGRYPSPRDCTIAEDMPNESTIRRHYPGFIMYHEAIYAADDSLPPVVSRSSRQTSARATRACWGAEGLAGEAETWQEGSGWLEGSNLTSMVLGVGPCSCQWCEAYSHDPARHCTCAGEGDSCKACQEWEKRWDDDIATEPAAWVTQVLGRARNTATG